MSMTIREQLEIRETTYLSPYATLSSKSKGRERPEEECDIRPVFQRDRDRILHCKSFRRLKQKTQVFLLPKGDHYRTRLTHTLEVSQNARTIAKALRLNEDLTEAIALGHDLGHTPFGHAGERALNQICPLGFRHHEQSVRVVERLERQGRGLNLTWEVRDGIRNHKSSGNPHTLEGQIVRLSDKIAYINHDIEDAVRAGVLREADLPYDCVYVLGRTKSARISTIIHSLVENSSDDIRMAPEVYRAHLRLRAFMFEAVYRNPAAKQEEGKAEEIVAALYRHFLQDPGRLPGMYQAVIARFGEEEAVCDHVAGMTDQYAVELYKELYIPKFWSK